MQIDPQLVLDMAEQTGEIVFFDIESTGTHADYNSILVASVKPFGKPPKTFVVQQPGNDKMLVRALRDELEKYVIWVGYYSKGFDAPMIRSRLLRHNMRNLEPRHHIDMYFALKAHTLTSRHSQSHLLSWLSTPEQKMTVSAEVWNQVLANPKRALRTLIDRCESDVAGLEALYKRTRHLLRDIKIE